MEAINTGPRVQSIPSSTPISPIAFATFVHFLCSSLTLSLPLSAGSSVHLPSRSLETVPRVPWKVTIALCAVALGRTPTPSALILPPPPLPRRCSAGGENAQPEWPPSPSSSSSSSSEGKRSDPGRETQKVSDCPPSLRFLHALLVRSNPLPPFLAPIPFRKVSIFTAAVTIFAMPPA